MLLWSSCSLVSTPDSLYLPPPLIPLTLSSRMQLLHFGTEPPDCTMAGVSLRAQG